MSANYVSQGLAPSGYVLKCGRWKTIGYDSQYLREKEKPLKKIDNRSPEQREFERELKRKPKGAHDYSAQAKRRKMMAADNFVNIFKSAESLKNHWLFYKNTTGWHHRSPVNITLTVPNQTCSDYELKEVALHNLINTLKYSHNVKLWVWGMESQANGNGHFHLWVDCFVTEARIRFLWFKQLQKLNCLGTHTDVELESNLVHLKEEKNLDLVLYKMTNYQDQEEDVEGNLVHKHNPEISVRKIEGNSWGCCKELKYEPLKVFNAPLKYYRDLLENSLYKAPIFNKDIDPEASQFDDSRFEVAYLYRNVLVKENPLLKIPVIKRQVLMLDNLMLEYHYLHAREVWGNKPLTKEALVHFEKSFQIILALKALVNYVELVRDFVSSQYVGKGLRSRSAVEAELRELYRARDNILN